MLHLSNDLRDRDQQISLTESRVLELRRELEHKGRVLLQEEALRLALTQRLEEVLMEKEEVLEQLESFEQFQQH